MTDSGSCCYNDLRLQGLLCDAVIKVEDVEFNVHKLILCNISDNFRALFLRWSTPDKKMFNIPGLSSDMMELIINFAYTGSVSVTEENVQELVIAADQFNVMDLIRICWDFLAERLCPENCIGIWKFTETVFTLAQRFKAFRYIVEHFEEVICFEEFLELSMEELVLFLEKDDLNVKAEKSVFDAIIRWIGHLPNKRQRYISLLFSKVRLSMLTRQCIMLDIMANDLVRNNPQCMELIYTLLHNRIDGHSPFMRHRLPTNILMAVGGLSQDQPTNLVEVYSHRANEWINVTGDIDHLRGYHGTVFLNGYVYCVGGYNRVEYFNSMRRLDVSTFIWDEAAPMHHCRCYVSVTELDGYIYALGGLDGRFRLSTAERYKPETNQWSLIAPMSERRSDASCTAFNGRVYVCGGFDGNECLQTCEYYTPETNQWTGIAPMLSARSGVSIAVYAGRLFAVGGFNGINCLPSVESYNPTSDTWNEVSSMGTPRSSLGIAVLDDRLFAVGGYNGSSTTSTVEYYSASTDRWSSVRDMEIPRSALSCCVVPRVLNIDKFTFPRDSLNPDTQGV